MDDLIARASSNVWVLIGSGIGLAIAAFLLALLVSIREKMFSVIPKLIEKLKKASPSRKDADQNHKVYRELVEMKALTDADRAYVLRFHNGSDFLPDNPVWKVSCSHEIVKDGVSYESGKLQEILVSRVHDRIDPIITGQSSFSGVKLVDCSKCQFKAKCDRENKHVVVIQVDEMEGSYGKFLLEGQNIKTVIQSGMVGGGRVFGVVAMDICDAKLVDDTMIREAADRVCRTAEKIQYHLLFKEVPPYIPASEKAC